MSPFAARGSTGLERLAGMRNDAMAATVGEEGGSMREVLRGLVFLRRHGGWRKKGNNVTRVSQ